MKSLLGCQQTRAFENSLKSGRPLGKNLAENFQGGSPFRY
jgi:hypothetical protein